MINTAITRYFKLAITEANNSDLTHLKGKVEKYLKSDKINNETKIEIVKMFTTSSQGKIKIVNNLIAHPITEKLTVTIKKHWDSCTPTGKKIYKNHIVIDSKYIKVTSKLVIG